MPRSWFATPKSSIPTGPLFCCYGCRLAASVMGDRGEDGESRRTLTRLGLAVFFSMNVMAFTMALWSSDVYHPTESGPTALSNAIESVFRYLVMLFSIPVLILLGEPIWANAIESLKRGIFSTDLLLGAGIAASFVYSSVSVVRGVGPIYFEVGCVVLVMVTLGRWIEATGKQKANDALDRLARLLPDEVKRVRDGVEEHVALGEIVVGDLIRVLPGERIPVDGRVVRGIAFVDEQVLTGESEAVARQPDDSIFGGTMNVDGDLLIEVNAAGSSGTLARLIEMVRNARQTKGRYERLADRFSTAFVPIIAVIALVTLVVEGTRSGWDQGLLQGLSVILIACPCALGLATPLAVWTALGQAAKTQVLFRSGDSLERLADIKAIRFDKTGTLTTGNPALIEICCESPEELDATLRDARLLAGASQHVLSHAILRSTPADSADQTSAVDDIRTHPGRGITGSINRDGKPILILLGSRRLLIEREQRIGPVLEDASRRVEEEGRSVVWLASNGSARGLFIFREQLRASARGAIAKCQALGLDVRVLTGDHSARGGALSKELTVPVESGLLPEGKVESIERARAEFGTVVMVGDGINDAPALAAGDLGVALGCGTDLSRNAASICLLSDDLELLPWAIELSRRTIQVIRGNLFWAFGYNAVGVAFAAVGWLSPAFASILMVGSSGFVILNSLRLNRAEPSVDQAVSPALTRPSAKVEPIA